jgi:WD40 repeat protein/tetratricopeptide (TPR) repeat protein
MANNQLMVSTPYVGPRPFGRSDKDKERFFGREREIDAILSRMYGQHVTLVCAASGAGKTSLFNAGVTPSLLDLGVQVLPMARVGGVPAEELGTQSLRGVRNVYMHNALMTLAPDDEPSSLKDVALRQFLSRWDRERKHRLGRPELRVVAFDQFEEIFTLYRSGSQREQAAFFKQVAQALEVDPDLRVVFLIREEYLAQLEPFAWLLPPDLNAYFRLEPLDADAALQAITGPLERTIPRRAYGEGVAETLVKELRKIHRKGQTDSTTTILGPYVEPMQLQGVCELLWIHLPPDAVTITHEHRRRFGNVNRALAKLYQRAIQQAVDTGEVDERTLRDWFDRKLITPVRTRGTIYSDGRHAGGIPMHIVRLLEDSHILRVQHRAELPWYELAHDRWIEPILEANERWRSGIKNPLTEPARVWADQQQPENLLRGQRLKEGARWAALHGNALNSRERRFLAASQREAEQRRREKQHASQLARLVEDLTAQRRILLSYEVIASANANLGEDPERSVLLALYAVAATSAAQGTVTSESEEALRHSVQALRVQRRIVHRGKVRAVAFSPDGSRLATTSEDGTIGLWDVTSGRRLLTLPGQPMTYAVAYSPDGTYLATACDDRMARIWRIAADEESPALIHHPERVFGVALSGDGRLATAGADGRVRIWDAASGEQLLEIDHGATVWDVAFSPDGLLLASAGEGRAAKVWDAASGEKLLTLGGHRHYVQCVSFSPDGKQLATGSLDLTAKIWEASSGKPLRTLFGHSGTISAVTFSPDSTLLATASIDSTVKLWRWEFEQALETLRGHHQWVTDIAYGPDGHTLATAGWDGTARIWRINGRETVTFSHGGKAARAVAFSPDGTRIAAAESGGVVRIFDSASGHTVTSLFGHVGNVNAIAFSPDGKRLATAGSDWRAKLWDAADGRELRTLAGHAGPVRDIEWSREGRVLATGGDDRTVKVWDTENVSSPRTISCRGAVAGLAFSPDGRRLATASWGDAVGQVWDLHGDGQPLLFEVDGGLGLRAVSFSADGTKLATAGEDRIVKIWDAVSGAPLRELPGHSSAVTALAFSPDSLRLATASWDFSARVWELATGKQVLTLSDHGDKLNGIAFSPDGTLLATAGDDGTTRLHLTTVHDLVDLARQRVTRGLNSEECHAWLQRSEPNQPDCPNEIVAVRLLVEARAEAETGRLNEAASTLREALELDANLGINPEGEARRMAVSAVLARARGCAVRKDLQGATRALRDVSELDPGLGLRADTDASQMVASCLIEEARWLAYEQHLEEATSKLREAIGLLEDLDLDPEVEARRVAAVAQVSRGSELVEDGEVEQALAAYRRADELCPELDIPASAFNILCWYGSLLGYAAQVQQVGDRAVQLLPDPDIRDSRGVARALNGDYHGAIEDFEAFVESKQASEGEQPSIEKRKQWIASLRVGQNPFSQEVLADLRNE